MKPNKGILFAAMVTIIIGVAGYFHFATLYEMTHFDLAVRVVGEGGDTEQGGKLLLEAVRQACDDSLDCGWVEAGEADRHSRFTIWLTECNGVFEAEIDPLHGDLPLRERLRQGRGDFVAFAKDLVDMAPYWIGKSIEKEENAKQENDLQKTAAKAE